MSKKCCNGKKFPWWILIVALVVAPLSGFLYWLIHQRRRVLNIEPYIQLESAGEKPAEKKDEAVAAPIPEAAEDLTLIDGIGPKIQAVLQAAGIRTFRQLAECPVEQLREITRAAGLRLADPTHWPAQAAFAARNDIKGLQDFQMTIAPRRRSLASN